MGIESELLPSSAKISGQFAKIPNIESQAGSRRPLCRIDKDSESRRSHERRNSFESAVQVGHVMERHHADYQVILTGNLGQVALLEGNPWMLVLRPGQVDHCLAEVDGSNMLVVLCEQMGQAPSSAAEIDGRFALSASKDTPQPPCYPTAGE